MPRGDTLMHGPADDDPALLDRRALAAYLAVSLRTLDRLDSVGRLPQALRLGVARSLKRWRRCDIDGWLRAGAPDRQTWRELLGDAS